MSLSAKISALAQRVATEFNTLRSQKQDTLVSGTSIKTVNGESLLGSGDIEVQGGNSNPIREYKALPLYDYSPFLSNFELSFHLVTSMQAYPTLSNTNVYTRTRRAEYFRHMPSTSNTVMFRSYDGYFFRGDAAGQGGFLLRMRFGIHSGMGNSYNRFFAGVIQNEPYDTNPTNFTNCFGVGWNSQEYYFCLIHNDSSGTATKTYLSFPKPQEATDFYELEISCESNASSMSYTLTQLGTTNVVSGSASSNLPANNVFLRFIMWTSVGGANDVCGLAIGGVYLQIP